MEPDNFYGEPMLSSAATRREYGPITADDVRQWIAEGRLSAQSLAKGAGDTSWRTLGSFAEFADAFTRRRPRPLHHQPQASKPYDSNWQAEVLARSPEIETRECLGAGWSFLAANAGWLTGRVFLTWVTNLVFVLGSLVVPILARWR